MSSLEFDMSIEENATHQVDHSRPVPASATGAISGQIIGGGLDGNAASPYNPVSPQVMLPSPTMQGISVGQEKVPASSPLHLPAMVAAMTDIVHVSNLETNQAIKGNVAEDPVGCMHEWVELNQDVFIARLAEFVAIKGVSSDPKCRPLVIQSVGYVKRWCEILGGRTELRDIGEEELHDGSGDKIPLPPVLMATFGDDDPTKRTLCVYGHVDVQPAEVSDGWKTEDPFKLTEIDGNLYARGSSDDKAPVLGWLWAIEFHRKFNIPLPVNFKCIFEGMEESGSLGFEKCLQEVKDTFLSDVDGVCVSDNYWIGLRKPCVTYGLRGIVYFSLEVSGGSKDLHSGNHGGAVLEPMTDLMKLLASMTDSTGAKILIDGLYDEVRALTQEEREFYTKLEDFDLTQYGAVETGRMLLSETEEAECLMRRWRYPSLSLHGIEGAFSGAGCKTVIPRKVLGKFSIRSVPDMTVAGIEKCVREHLVRVHAESGSKNVIKLKNLHSGEPWLADTDSFNFKAAIKASERVHGVQPNLTREGGSIPIVVSFAKMCPAPIVLLPIGAADDGAHSQNEKISRWHLVQGTKTLGTYIHEFASI